MAADALVDTGAILALQDRTDRWHRICVDTFRQLRLPLLTSEAVVTELFQRWR
jgi:predicted nucleic acid-binding protein